MVYMLTDQDKTWLSEKHPGLALSEEGISGTIEFTATYNDQSNCFLVLEEGAADTVGGLRLAGSFKIRIQERTSESFSSLPQGLCRRGGAHHRSPL